MRAQGRRFCSQLRRKKWQLLPSPRGPLRATVGKQARRDASVNAGQRGAREGVVLRGRMQSVQRCSSRRRQPRRSQHSCPHPSAAAAAGATAGGAAAASGRDEAAGEPPGGGGRRGRGRGRGRAEGGDGAAIDATVAGWHSTLTSTFLLAIFFCTGEEECCT
jgi:hypothetical protein